MLCTLDDLKSYLGIDNANQDVLLTNLINGASAFIENYTNRDFSIQVYTEQLHGTGKKFLPVQNSPIVDVISVTDDNGVSYNVDFIDTMLIMPNYGVFTKGVFNWAISYHGGLSVVPDDVAQACKELAAYKFKDRDRIGLKSKGLAGEVISYEKKDIRGEIQNVLANYVRVY
jgi:hypothetical protein